jgi:hypothetical protein
MRAERSGLGSPTHQPPLFPSASSAVAMRYLEPVAEYDEAGAVTDPETGLTFGYLRYTETQSNRIFVTVECLYGYKQAIADGIKRIVKP